MPLEPLAQFIRHSADMQPISVGRTSHHLALYADDLVVFMENPLQSLPSLLSICSEFGDISGFKINWDKSSLLPLNDAAKKLQFPPNVPVVQQFRHLGVQIFPSLNRIVSHNYLEIWNKVKSDLGRWTSLPNSLRARISIVKMNVLPRINFVSSMIPLAPPVNYWKEIQSSISQFIWNRKRPRLKMATLQRHRADGGLAVPNFRLYFYSFVLRPLFVWVNADISVSWRGLEEDIVRPMTLQGVLFSDMSNSQCKRRFGPIVSFLIQTWRTVESLSKISCKWHTFSPVFHNERLMIGSRPIVASPWSNSNIRYLGDIFSGSGLSSFQDLRVNFALPAFSFFFYLQLRHALSAHSISLQQALPVHPLYKLVTARTDSRGLVSELNSFFLESSYSDLVLDRLWRSDHPDLDPDFDWDQVWTISGRLPATRTTNKFISIMSIELISHHVDCML